MADYDWGEELPRLESERVVLRWLRSEDAPALFEIFADDDVSEFWSSPTMQRLEQAEQLVAEIHRLSAERSLFEWGICTRESEDIVGTCTLYQWNVAHRRAELGIALNRRVWGQGLAREALGLMIDFAFETLDLHRLEADIDPKNERSLQLFERFGFQREGYLRERWHVHGGVHDSVVLGLLSREWTRRAPTDARAAGS